MSVVEPERHKGRLEVHVKAQALAAYTALIVKNPKVFDPEVDEDLIKRIKSYSMDIYEKAWAANKINAETNQINRAMRYQLQEEALLCCDRLHADIGIAKSVFHLRCCQISSMKAPIHTTVCITRTCIRLI